MELWEPSRAQSGAHRSPTSVPIPTSHPEAQCPASPFLFRRDRVGLGSLPPPSSSRNISFSLEQPQPERHVRIRSFSLYHPKYCSRVTSRWCQRLGWKVDCPMRCLEAYGDGSGFSFHPNKKILVGICSVNVQLRNCLNVFFQRHFSWNPFPKIMTLALGLEGWHTTCIHIYV